MIKIILKNIILTSLVTLTPYSICSASLLWYTDNAGNLTDLSSWGDVDLVSYEGTGTGSSIWWASGNTINKAGGGSFSVSDTITDLSAHAQFGSYFVTNNQNLWYIDNAGNLTDLSSWGNVEQISYEGTGTGSSVWWSSGNTIHKAGGGSYSVGGPITDVSAHAQFGAYFTIDDTDLWYVDNGGNFTSLSSWGDIGLISYEGTGTGSSVWWASSNTIGKAGGINFTMPGNITSLSAHAQFGAYFVVEDQAIAVTEPYPFIIIMLGLSIYTFLGFRHQT